MSAITCASPWSRLPELMMWKADSICPEGSGIFGRASICAKVDAGWLSFSIGQNQKSTPLQEQGRYSLTDGYCNLFNNSTRPGLRERSAWRYPALVVIHTVKWMA